MCVAQAHLDCHAHMRPVEEDVPVTPCGQPGELVAARRAQRADSLVQGHHPVNEGCQQARLTIPCDQDLVQGLSTQHITLHAPHDVTQDS